MRTQGQRKSQLQEKRTARDLGGRVQPGSGARDFAKGDVRKVGKVRVECKTTGAKSYALKISEIQKIKAESLNGFEDWAMQIEFQGGLGNNKKVAVIDWNSYLDMLDSTEDSEA